MEWTPLGHCRIGLPWGLKLQNRPAVKVELYFEPVPLACWPPATRPGSCCKATAGWNLTRFARVWPTADASADTDALSRRLSTLRDREGSARRMCVGRRRAGPARFGSRRRVGRRLVQGFGTFVLVGGRALLTRLSATSTQQPPGRGRRSIAWADRAGTTSGERSTAQPLSFPTSTADRSSRVNSSSCRG